MAVSHHFALWSPDFPRCSSKLAQRGDPGDSSLPNNTGDSCSFGHGQFTNQACAIRLKVLVAI